MSVLSGPHGGPQKKGGREVGGGERKGTREREREPKGSGTLKAQYEQRRGRANAFLELNFRDRKAKIPCGMCPVHV